MTRVEDVAQSALSAVSSSAGRLLAASWVNDRYKQLIGKVRFKHTRKLGELTVPATITAGVAVVTTGSRRIGGDATAKAAWAALTRKEGVWFFRMGTSSTGASDRVWYQVAGDSNGELLLTTPYVGASSNTTTYVLAKRYYDLPSNVRTLDFFIHQRRRRLFYRTPQELVESIDPDRVQVTDGPAYAHDIGFAEPNGRRIELYPPSATAELVSYLYRELPDKLKLTDELPAVIDGYVLKEGVLVDVMRWEQAQAAKSGKPEIAALWRNDSRAQETKWDKAIQAAIMADRGVDDLTFIWQSARFLGPAMVAPTDIVTAQDHIWSR